MRLHAIFSYFLYLFVAQLVKQRMFPSLIAEDRPFEIFGHYLYQMSFGKPDNVALNDSLFPNFVCLLAYRMRYVFFFLEYLKSELGLVV